MRPLVYLGVVIALLVGIGVVIGIASLFVESACPSGEASPVPVLVAKQFIPKGTSGAVMAKRGMYTAAALPCRERKSGAIADPQELVGTRAANDVFPGQQLTDADLTSG